jgi:predicted nucleic acid-binding protein
LRQVVIDTNALLSTVLLRDEEQRAATQRLLDHAGNGELVIVLPQFVVFQAIYVLRSFYKLPPLTIRVMLREAMTLPAVTLTNDCPWPQFFEHWSDIRPEPVDAAILALAIANRYTLATFDHKLSKRARTFGVSPYW